MVERKRPNLQANIHPDQDYVPGTRQRMQANDAYFNQMRQAQPAPAAAPSGAPKYQLGVNPNDPDKARKIAAFTAPVVRPTAQIDSFNRRADAYEAQQRARASMPRQAAAPAQPAMQFVTKKSHPGMDWETAKAVNTAIASGQFGLAQQALQNKGALQGQELRNQGGLQEQVLRNQGGLAQQGMVNTGAKERQEMEAQAAMQRLQAGFTNEGARYTRDRGDQLSDAETARRYGVDDMMTKYGMETYLKTGNPQAAAAVQRGFGGQVPYADVPQFTPNESWDTTRIGQDPDGNPLYARLNKRTGEFYDKGLETRMRALQASLFSE